MVGPLEGQVLVVEPEPQDEQTPGPQVRGEAGEDPGVGARRQERPDVAGADDEVEAPAQVEGRQVAQVPRDGRGPCISRCRPM